jgi:hypothetical protein
MPYCDNCGGEHTSLVIHPLLPFNVASANKGESGGLCLHCNDTLHNLHDKADRLEALIEGAFGSGDDYLSPKQVKQTKAELERVIDRIEEFTR